MVFSGLRSGDRRGIYRSSKSSHSSNDLCVASATSSTSSILQFLGDHPISDPKTTKLEYISDESQIPPPEEEPPDLRQLNACLDALAVVFPNVQIEVFREMLSSFDGESRLFVVADALLKNRGTWVKGRWKVPDEPRREVEHGTQRKEEDATMPAVPRAETFRDFEFKKAVANLAWHEFKGLSRSTINAVLAENNYDYLPSRRELLRISQKSWRFTLSSLIFRRRTPAEEAKDTGALVSWRSTRKGLVEPTLKTTGNPQLDRELFEALIQPLQTEKREKQLTQDAELAVQMNYEEAEKHDALFECACCYSDVAFEELCSCTGESSHQICHRCVQHCVSEAVFGQGWKQIDEAHGTLKCPAVDSTDCTGLVPPDQLGRAMSSQPDGSGILCRLDLRLADLSLASTGIPLIRCPFCDYAEVDDVYHPSSTTRLRLKLQVITFFAPIIAYAFASSPALVSAIMLIFVLCVYITPITALTTLSVSVSHLRERPKLTGIPSYLKAEFRTSVTRHLRRQRGLRFTCLSPQCGRSSCISCLKPWTDIHVCNESALVALRTQVEQAMSLAIKRVCPRCNTSFVKTSGCNKLTCPCGYKMCYVCRKDIGGVDGEGYRHFCDHFRPEGDGTRCKMCDRCNLWEAEDTDAVLKKAKEKAEVEWREQEGRELSGTERRFLETGVSGKGVALGVVRGLFASGNFPSVSEVCDMIVESTFV